MAHDEHDSLQQLGMFDDPTKMESKSSPTYLTALLGGFLLVYAASFGSYLWDTKLSQKLHASPTAIARQEQVSEMRWGWEPYRLEYQLYKDRGFNTAWLEGSAMRKIRKTLGKLAPFMELIALRIFGVFNFFIPMLIVFCFALSLGCIRYHNKRFQFKHVSSTFNNASIKVLFLGAPLTLLWALFPFGVSIPFIGGIPILAHLPGAGVIWISSPLLGACFFGLLFCFVAFILGANFSREI